MSGILSILKPIKTYKLSSSRQNNRRDKIWFQVVILLGIKQKIQDVFKNNTMIRNNQTAITCIFICKISFIYGDHVQGWEEEIATFCPLLCGLFVGIKNPAYPRYDQFFKCLERKATVSGHFSAAGRRRGESPLFCLRNLAQ